MISAMKDSSIKRNRKKSFRVTFAPGTKTEEEQINNFVKAVENNGPGIDDLSKMIKSLPNKKSSKSASTEKRKDQEAESITNMIFQLRKTLDNMLEKECNDSINESVKVESERRPSNSSITSVDSAIGDCSKSNEYYNQLKAKDEAKISKIDDIEIVNNDTSSMSSPNTRKKVSDLLMELDNCIEGLREEDTILEEDSTSQDNSLCVKDIFASGILIASFVQTKTETTPLEQQYAVLTDDTIYIFESNKSKSPLKFTFSIENCNNIKKSIYITNAIELNGEYKNVSNENVAKSLSLAFSSEEECSIWIKLLLDINKSSFSPSRPYPKRTVSLKSNVNNNYYNEMSTDYYNPRQTILSALCVLEGIEKSL
ncbi:hypothetical protein H8356DRAFT_1714463 [Neocallimastix lanati (nom. inval.)]|nr:hypothetical protein H8356DRAFT_1714463 [Neocallimastix sp. JGI-2020a]